MWQILAREFPPLHGDDRLPQPAARTPTGPHLSKHHVPEIHQRTAVREALVEEDVVEVGVAVAKGERLRKESAEDAPLAAEHERRPLEHLGVVIAEACREGLEARTLKVTPDVATRACVVVRVRRPLERVAPRVPPPACVQPGE